MKGGMTMKRNTVQVRGIRAGLILVVVFILLSVSQSFAMLNRAVLYCKALGYENLTGLTKKGETALCKLPKDEIVDANDFLSGKIALKWSYCARKGFEAKRVEKSDICRDCTVCVLPDGSETEVTKLMGLDVGETTCGDGSCGMPENFSNCPRDCPSGGSDNFCDGVQDQRCDFDCVERGESDPDCPLIFVDIKPGSCSNSLKLPLKSEKGKGVLPVAILGTAQFDVKTINPSTVRLKRPECKECRGVSPVRWSYKDVATPYPGGEECGCHKMGRDGYLDLNLKFDLMAISEDLKLHDASGQIIPITIKADLWGDQDAQIRARDCIMIQEKKTKGDKGKKTK
jgi:putative hemolysin